MAGMKWFSRKRNAGSELAQPAHPEATKGREKRGQRAKPGGLDLLPPGIFVFFAGFAGIQPFSHPEMFHPRLIRG